MTLEQELDAKIKSYKADKAEIDRIRRKFVKDDGFAVAVCVIAFLVLVCVPLSAWIVLELSSDMTVYNTKVIDRTRVVHEQPIVTNYPTTYVNTTQFVEPEYMAECIKVQAAGSNKYRIDCMKVRE